MYENEASVTGRKSVQYFSAHSCKKETAEENK